LGGNNGGGESGLKCHLFGEGEVGGCNIGGLGPETRKQRKKRAMAGCGGLGGQWGNNNFSGWVERK